MTESEAKKKWCPFASSVHTCNNILTISFHVANRGIDGSVENVLCLGSACMAWNEKEGCMMIPRPVDRKWRSSEAVKNA